MELEKAGVPSVAVHTNVFARLAQRFPVRITLEDGDPRFPFRMGATAVVTIEGEPPTMAAPIRSQSR